MDIFTQLITLFASLAFFILLGLGTILGLFQIVEKWDYMYFIKIMERINNNPIGHFFVLIVKFSPIINLTIIGFAIYFTVTYWLKPATS